MRDAGCGLAGTEVGGRYRDLAAKRPSGRALPKVMAALEFVMTKYQNRCLDMFVRVRCFGEIRPDSFVPESPGGPPMATVRQVETDIRALATLEVNAVDDRRRRAMARAKLTRSLLLVARAARQIERLDGPGKVRFVMPTPRTDGRLLETARAFLRDAALVQDRFIALGLQPTFLADLDQLVDAFAWNVDRRRAAQRESVAVRVGYKEAFKRGFDAVLSLDVFIATAFSGDPVSLEGWKSARRVDRRRRRAEKARKRQPPQTRGPGAEPI